MNVWLWSAAAIALVVTALLVRRFCDPSSKLYLLDHPNERSLHSHPTPRSGGVAIVTGVGVGISVVWVAVGVPTEFGWLLAGAGLVALLSFMDDRRGISVVTRFVAHVVGAGLVTFGAKLSLSVLLPGLGPVVPAWLGAAIMLLFLVWMINLYNFMDGMDGFAGGMAVFGFGSFALLGFMAGHLPLASISLVIAAAAGGFLLFNFPPARIFMGDAGSATLGLLAGGLSLWGTQDGVFPFWIALLVFSPFIVDATVTLLRRLARRERVWEAHRTHYYQRLVQSGWGHRRTVLAEYALMLACSGTAVLSLRLGVGGQWGVIVAWIGIYAALMFAVSALERRHKASTR